MKIGALFATALTLSLFAGDPAALAAGDGQGVLVTVNDYPITSYDVEQRVRLNAILGRTEGSIADQRKRALQAVIDDVIKLVEAKKYKADPNDKTIDAQIDKMAKGSKTDAKGLAAQLKAKGASMGALRRLVAAQIAFNRLLNAMYKVKVEIDPAEVDKKYNELVNDPRMQPVTVYEIMEIEMPVENIGKRVSPPPRRAPARTKPIAWNGWAKAITRSAEIPASMICCRSASSGAENSMIGSAKTKKATPISDIQTTQARVAVSVAARARAGLLAPSDWPTSAVAAIEKPKPGNIERKTACWAMLWPATTAVPSMKTTMTNRIWPPPRSSDSPIAGILMSASRRRNATSGRQPSRPVPRKRIRPRTNRARPHPR